MGRIGNWPVAREPRRLVADEAHPVRHELDRIRARRFLQHFAGAGVDLAAIDARPDWLARRHLDLVHFAKQVLEFAVWLALDRHATEIAAVAFVIAAGPKRQDVARTPRLVGARAIEALPGRDEPLFKRQARVPLLAAKG